MALKQLTVRSFPFEETKEIEANVAKVLNEVPDMNSPGFVAGVVLLAALRVGQEPAALADFTGLSLSQCRLIARRMKTSGLWVDGKFAHEWLQSKTEGDGISFLMDTMVAKGLLKCTTKAKRASKARGYSHTKYGLRDARRLLHPGRAKP